jgi:hypothetical protein
MNGVLPRLFPDQFAQGRSVLIAHTATQVTVVRAVIDFDTQITKRIGENSQGVQHQAFRVRNHLRIIMEPFVGMIGLCFERRFTGQGFQA